MEELVNHPSHYNQGKYEVIEVLEGWGLVKHAYAWNFVKYLSRAGAKVLDSSKPEYYYKQDINKAIFYLKRHIQHKGLMSLTFKTSVKVNSRVICFSEIMEDWKITKQDPRYNFILKLLNDQTKELLKEIQEYENSL